MFLVCITSRVILPVLWRNPDKRHLGLARLRVAAPRPDLETVGDARQSREEPVELAAYVVPLAGREGSDISAVRLAHGVHHSISGHGVRAAGLSSLLNTQVRNLDVWSRSKVTRV